VSYILADTCIWINSFDNAVSTEAKDLARLIDSQRLVIAGVVLTEFLTGVKDRTVFEVVADKLSSFPLIDPKRQTWILAGKIGAEMRSKGKNIPFSDLLLAALCIEHSISLYTHDKHFLDIPSLKLWPEKK